MPKNQDFPFNSIVSGEGEHFCQQNGISCTMEKGILFFYCVPRTSLKGMSMSLQVYPSLVFGTEWILVHFKDLS